MNGSKASDCVCVTADEVLTWALQAFFQAGRDCRPPPGVLWREPGHAGTWSSRGMFLWFLNTRFTERLSARGAGLCIRTPGCATESLGWNDFNAVDDWAFSLPALNDLPPVENRGNNRSHGALRGG